MATVRFGLLCFLCMCAGPDGNAQPAKVYAEKYNAYHENWSRPKLHLILNQDKFSPGDSAWFKAYFLKDDLTALPGQQILEVNLVDSAGQSRAHSFTATYDGKGAGQMIIPQAIAPGIYLITAHSSWMLNFPGYFFQKKIEIVQNKELTEIRSPSVQARPEGGHLLRGVSTNVMVRSHPPQARVQVVDAAGHEVGNVTTDGQGFGVISFLPAGNTSYFAKISGEAQSTALPSVEGDGCNLIFVPASTRSAKAQITISPASALSQKDLILLVTAGGKVRHSSSVNLGSEARTELEIPLDKLPPGTTHLALLSANGVALASRDFYNMAIDTIHAKIETSKPYLHNREKVKIDVTLVDASGKPVTGEFSLNVLNKGLFEDHTNSLSEELTIPIRAKESFSVDLKSEAGLRQLDIYLALHTQEEPWQAILAKERTEPTFGYTNFLQKKGKAIFSGSGKPVPEAQILFYLQENNVRQESKIEKGNVWLPLNNVLGGDQLLYFGETFYYVGGEKHGEEIADLKIEWTETHVDLPPGPAFRQSDRTDSYGDFTAKRRLIDKSFGFFSSRNQDRDGALPNQSEFEDEVSEADVTINVQDYIIFPTMAELVKEVIPSLFHRKAGGKDVVRVALSDAMWAMVSGGPVYVIDGVVTKDTDYFLSLKPVDLLTVKIVNSPQKLKPLGMMGKNGIVVVRTKKGDAREPINPSGHVEGLNLPLKFRTSDYSAKNSSRPDFRSTIYWNPSITTDANGKATIEFFSTDDVGILNIRVDGMTSDNKPFTAVTHIDVGLTAENK